MDFTAELNRQVARIEAGIDLLLPGADFVPARLAAAMRYSVQAGGKRLRPVLVLAAADLFRGDRSATGQSAGDSAAPNPIPAAVAVECLHTYSLVHDDLPCMDDDELRRGRPTLHKAYDEATALLAGDALLTLAFQILGRHYRDNPVLTAVLVRELGDAAGCEQLIGGQMLDLLYEKSDNATEKDLNEIHARKTAAMITASLVMGGLVGGANEAQVETLRSAGRHLGLAFQIIDDVLDATADSATLGKTAGKDAKANKTTFVKLHGIDEVAAHRAEHVRCGGGQAAGIAGGDGLSG